ncbi:MAG: aconitase X, partial [Promethearchaeota archaeon]
MFLTAEEERILDGEEGYARQLAMKIVVKLGEIFSAD